jgi:hypothetical protein
MSFEFPLPDVGEGLTEADIVAWKVAPGDTVTVNQILVEIETAKSLVELPSPQAGTVGALLVERGRPSRSAPPSSASVTPIPAPRRAPPPEEPMSPHPVPHRSDRGFRRGVSRVRLRTPTAVPRSSATARRRRRRSVVPARAVPSRPRLLPRRRLQHPLSPCARGTECADITCTRGTECAGRPRTWGRGRCGCRLGGVGNRQAAGEAARPQAREGPRRRPHSGRAHRTSR